MTRAALVLPLLLLAAACGQPAPAPPPAPTRPAAPVLPPAPAPAPTPAVPGAEDAAAAAVSASDASDAPPPVEPNAPGTPGGLPDDRTPLSEAPFSPTSAQGAADVVQVYFASVSIGDYDKAWRQLGPQARARFGDTAGLRKAFRRYQSYQAQVGGPGAIEGAAGSLYVEVPVQVYGRRATGEEMHALGKVTLRRSNDVPGSSAEQRSWRIARMTVEP